VQALTVHPLQYSDQGVRVISVRFSQLGDER
jgi:hypothetical protein